MKKNANSISDKAQKYFIKRQSQIDRERVERIGKLEAAMDDFVKKFSGVESVYIVGSLVKPEFYRSESDADIVVKGLTHSNILKASSYLERVLSMSLDVILWSDIEPDSNILKRKRKIYEKTNKISR